MSTHEHDQTRGDSTAYFKDGQAADLSCNEVSALCTKAARGAGMSWGMAQEAGFAAAWLTARGIDGPGLIRQHLDRSKARQWSDLCPLGAPGNWQGLAGLALCPIHLGATICDFANLVDGPLSGAMIALGPVATPALLLPFLADFAKTNAKAITLTSPDGSICIGGDMDWLQGAVVTFDTPECALQLAAAPALPSAIHAPQTHKATTTPATVQALNSRAMNTTVPASEASRAGAGSGQSDND